MGVTLGEGLRLVRITLGEDYAWLGSRLVRVTLG